MTLEITHLFQDQGFQHWLEATAMSILLAIFVILKVVQKLQREAEDEEYERYFKRLDDAEKRRGI